MWECVCVCVCVWGGGGGGVNISRVLGIRDCMVTHESMRVWGWRVCGLYSGRVCEL